MRLVSSFTSSVVLVPCQRRSESVALTRRRMSYRASLPRPVQGDKVAALTTRSVGFHRDVDETFRKFRESEAITFHFARLVPHRVVDELLDVPRRL